MSCIPVMYFYRCLVAVWLLASVADAETCGMLHTWSLQPEGASN
jgi:hypothetical protein